MADSLVQLRADYDVQGGRSLALPLAGAIVWAVVGIAALFLTPRTSSFVLVIGTGAIFPIGLLLAVVLRERLLNNTNPLAKLMGMSVLMVNLLWAVHISLLYIAPTLISLTLGISLGLHWIVFSWIIQHPLGRLVAFPRTPGQRSRGGRGDHIRVRDHRFALSEAQHGERRDRALSRKLTRTGPPLGPAVP